MKWCSGSGRAFRFDKPVRSVDIDTRPLVLHNLLLPVLILSLNNIQLLRHFFLAFPPVHAYFCRSEAASSSNSTVVVKRGQLSAEALAKRALKTAAAKKEALLLEQEMENLTSLDLDYEIDENELEDIDDEDYQETPKVAGDKKTVKLSSILPKPSPKATPKSTPTTSGKRGR